MSDIVERLKQFGTKWPYDAAADEIESLRQQLSEANNQVNQLNNMMRDKGFGQGEIDTMGWYEQQLAECQKFDAWKANPYTKILEDSLAECQAREKVLQDVLSKTQCFLKCSCVANPIDKIDDALAIPSDSTALDTMLKQAKREALLEAAEYCDNQWCWSDAEYQQYEQDVGDVIRRMAEELE